jgi:ProP effector
MSAHIPGGTPTDPPSAAPAEPDALSLKTEEAAVVAPEPGADAAPADAAVADAPVAEAPVAEAPVADAPAAEAAAGGAPAPGELSPAACGTRLAELFPALFVGPTGQGPFKPIKLRIQADIQARAPGLFSKRTLGIFFSRYTTTGAYLKALAAPGAQRFDLDGQPAGEIAEEHRAAAVEELARRHAIAAERRAAQRRGPPRHDGAPAAAGAEGAAPQAGDAAAAGTAERPPRLDRPPRPQRPARPEGARPDARGPRDAPRRGPLDAPGRAPRDAAQEGPRNGPRDGAPGGPRSGPRNGPRSDSRDGQRRGPHGDRPNRGDFAPRQGGPRADFRADARGTGSAPQRAPEPTLALPADPAQRERALLLRAFEASPLSKANFCALKRMSEADLDSQLAQARAERGR